LGKQNRVSAFDKVAILTRKQTVIPRESGSDSPFSGFSDFWSCFAWIDGDSFRELQLRHFVYRTSLSNSDPIEPTFIGIASSGLREGRPIARVESGRGLVVLTFFMVDRLPDFMEKSKLTMEPEKIAIEPETEALTAQNG
jgi:hypothetical protein